MSDKACTRIYRILAAQMAEVQGRFERCSGELIATLDGLEAGMAADPAGAVAALQSSLDTLLFTQAQEHDLIRQMMGVLAKVLTLLPDDITIDLLPSLYVSGAQLTVHEAVLAAPLDAGDAG